MGQRLMGMLSRVAVTCGIVLCMSGAAFAQEKVTARVDFTPAGPHAGLHLAVAKGWFKEVGLDVEVQDGRGSINTVQLVGAGQIDFGWAQLGVMAMGREAGLDVTSVAGFMRRGDLAVIVDAQAGIQSAKDLKGRKLVTFTGSTWNPFIDSFLKSAGLTRADVTIINVDPTGMFANYIARQSDGILTLGPFGVPIVNPHRESRQVVAADYGITFPSHGVVVREEMISKRPQTVQRFVQVLARSWQHILAGNEGEGVDAVIAARPGAKLDRNVLLGQINMYKEFVNTPNTRGRPLGWQSERDWEEAIKTLEAAGVVKPGKKPAQFFTNQFIR